jgi:beta-lactamase regulating signal transducer with metallopeptidase domain
MIDWLVTNALAALALAAIAGILVWTFRPAPAVRHALWLVVLLKLVAPGGPTVALPVPVDPPAEEKSVVATTPPPEMVVEAEVFTVIVHPKPGQTVEEAASVAMRAQRNPDEATDARTELTVAPQPAAEPPPAKPFNYRPWLLGLWVAGGVYVGWRQLRETLRFARFARNRRPAPDGLVAEVAVVANRLGIQVPAVRVLAGLMSPVMWCLGRPVLLWPAGLECRLKGDGRRAVIAHELAHLRRRDHWVRRLEMIAAVLHWWNPLFWVARKKLRADAELACDAWAAGQADRRAYAEALLEVCSFNPRRRPAPAVGVFGEGRRAMQERLTMIMKDRVPCRLAFGAKLVVALMAVAAVPAWTLGQSKPETVADVVIEVADLDGADDAQTKEIEAQIKALMQKLEALKTAKAAEAQKKATEKLKEAHEKLGEKMKELRLQEYKLHVAGQQGEAPKTVTGGAMKVLVSGKDGVKVIGPDGKEIKDAKVIIGGSEGGTHVVKPMTAGGAGPEHKVEVHVAGQEGKTLAVPSIRWTNAVPAGERATKYWVTGDRADGGNAITLSRATYKLSKDQATALSTLLGSIKATVMETKVDGDSITVTTTPEAQQSIGQIVRLIQGQGGNVRFEWKVAPDQGANFVAPRTSVTPPTPATPAKPARPPAANRPGTTDSGPERINVNVILDQLKKAGDEVKVNEADMAKLQEMLKALKPLELKLKTEESTGEKKPQEEKK